MRLLLLLSCAVAFVVGMPLNVDPARLPDIGWTSELEQGFGALDAVVADDARQQEYVEGMLSRVLDLIVREDLLYDQPADCEAGTEACAGAKPTRRVVPAFYTGYSLSPLECAARFLGASGFVRDTALDSLEESEKLRVSMGLPFSGAGLEQHKQMLVKLGVGTAGVVAGPFFLLLRNAAAVAVTCGHDIAADKTQARLLKLLLPPTEKWTGVPATRAAMVPEVARRLLASAQKASLMHITAVSMIYAGAARAVRSMDYFVRAKAVFGPPYMARAYSPELFAQLQRLSDEHKNF
eukprot:TRINITY_DN2078_c0_g1_i2.p2 TRINITY_DN2078_c0_g1~~TRINITY_DN2078_c0_g1_i2.p2  ORF type:complete len:294 (+),score=92.12 TRINITY_DN2078_c0_g1_i2:1055-1936(+)